MTHSNVVAVRLQALGVACPKLANKSFYLVAPSHVLQKLCHKGKGDGIACRPPEEAKSRN